MSALARRILAAYEALVSRPGGTIRLADLRAEIGVSDPEEVAATLLRLDRDRVIQLEPDPYRLGLTQADRECAVRLGGEDMHLLRVVIR